MIRRFAVAVAVLALLAAPALAEKKHEESTEELVAVEA